MGVTQKPGFSLGEIEAALAHMFGVHPAKRATFSARLQQLQRLGLPSGAQPGRGKRFRYEFWQVADFAVCVDLLDAGIPPNLLKTHFSGVGGVYSAVGMGAKIEHCNPTPTEGLHLFIEFRALNYLRSTDAGRTEEHAADHIMKFRAGAGYLIGETADTPVVVLNLSKRLHDLKASILEVLPHLAVQATFPPVVPRPGMIA